jgi:magnesium-protoporphyrin IX monomethyl ester (oxidative) cyclase
MERTNKNSKWPICLINPPALLPKSSLGVDLFQPLGLAYIAAILRDSHYLVSIIDALAEGWQNLQKFDKNRDFNGLSFAQIGKKIKKLKPKLVGITITFTVQKDSAFRVASVVKSIDNNIVVVVGGPHVTVRAEECLQNPNIDFAVIGEGEITIVELVKRLEAKSSLEELKKVKGIAFKDGKRVVVTDSRPLIQDLDSLPFPARDLLPMEIYFEAAKSKRASRDLDKPWASVFTSRGCPFNCVFCSIHLTMGKKWRARSPANIIEELKLIIKNYGVKQIDFEDDNISYDRKRMEEICNLIIKNNLKIEWFTPNGIRADTLDEPLLRKMKASGCRELWFAPESGSQRVVDEVIGKRINLKYVEKMVTACKKIGISSNCFFVIGLPGETKKEIEKTIAYAQRLGRLGADNCLFSIATPLYGTRLYREATEKGFLRERNDENLRYDIPQIKTPEFSPEELVELREQALKKNRQLFIRNSFSKLFYYMTHNPPLAVEQLNNLSRVGLIFLRRNFGYLKQRYLKGMIDA